MNDITWYQQVVLKNPTCGDFLLSTCTKHVHVVYYMCTYVYIIYCYDYRMKNIEQLSGYYKNCE